MRLILRISLRALLRNKLRTFLTLLGIIIGVATVISMLAIGAGARRSIEAGIQGLGTNVLLVMPGSVNQGGVRTGAFGHTNLTVADADAIARNCPSVAAVSPVTQNGAQVIYAGQNWQTQVNGVGPDFPVVRNWPMAEGRFFLPEEENAAARVCVLGTVVATQLFPNSDPVGKVVRIQSEPCRVLGVLAKKGDSAFGTSNDDVVVVPVSTAMKRLFNLSYLHVVMACADSRVDVDRARNEIIALLRQRHRIGSHEPDDFSVRTQAEFVAAADSSTGAFTMLLGGIASVSLFVGGIGIMNIMLVSVTERIREIGVRMALGATEADIRWQFLVESIVISLLGGAIGIATGWGIARLVAGLTSWPLVVSGRSMLLSVTFSAAVGVFFGLYPAFKASRLDPIEALRHE